MRISYSTYKAFIVSMMWRLKNGNFEGWYPDEELCDEAKVKACIKLCVKEGRIEKLNFVHLIDFKWEYDPYI